MSFPISITWSAGAPPVNVFNQLAQAATQLDSALQASGANFDRFGQTVQQLESPLSGVGTSMGQLEGSMSGLEGSLGGTADSMGEFAGSTEQLNGSLSETGGFVQETAGSMGELGSASTEAGSGVTELSSASTEAGTGVTELGTATTETGTALGETNTVLGETNTVLSETAPIMTETATGATDLAAGFSELKPPIEESNTALTETVPILEGAGTAAEDATSSTDTFSGALSGLNTEIEPVNGGLTDTNTLVGEVGGAESTTAGTTDTLNSAMVGLGTGIGTVTGSAMSMFSAFTNVRDAQAGVERAGTKVIDANTKLNTSINTLNRSINKIVADTENQISGQARLAAAQAKFNALIDAGVTSGPKFAAALKELRAAQDGLSSTTVKGNELIAKQGPLIDKVESASRKLTTANLNQTRANEGLAESFIGIAGSLVAGVSGFVQIATQGGAAAGKLAPLRGIITGIGTGLTTGLVPALAAIAAPAALAVAAVVGFVAAVEAIRANIKIFDDLGVAIGNTFPALRGFLTEGRQAFINFSDGLNTGISMLLGGFDSLTGGVFGAQKAWDGFTKTLPKGTGEMGLAANAANLWALSLSKLSDRVNIGAGKWREADGALFHMNGTVKTSDDTLKAAAGTWDVMADGTAFYLKTAEKVPPVQKTTTETTTQMSEATKKAADELAGLGTKLEEADAKVKFYSEGTKMAQLIQTSFALGVAEAKVELIDNTAELANGAGALQTYSQQLADGKLQALAYKQGILEAGMALKEKIEALHEAEGAYDATNVLIKEGTLLAVEYATGMQDTKTAVQDAAIEVVHLAGELNAYNDEATRATAIATELVKGYLEQQDALNKLATEALNAVGSIAALRIELEDSGSAATRFGAGLIEGREKALQYLVGIEQAKGETAGFRQEVLSAAQKIPGALGDMSSMSTKHLQRFIEVVHGVPEAFDQVINKLGGFQQKVVTALGKAGEEGKDAFMENIEAMEEELNTTFSEPLVRDLELAVQVDKAKKDVETALGILGATLSAQPLTPEMDTSRIHQAIGVIEGIINRLPPIAQKGFAPLQGWLDKLKQWQPGSGIAGLAPILAGIASSAEGMGEPMGNLLASFSQMTDLAGASAGELALLKKAFFDVGLQLNTTTGDFTNATGSIKGNIFDMTKTTQDPLTQLANGILGTGEAANQAKTLWATQMVAMKNVIAAFVLDSISLLANWNVAWTDAIAKAATSLGQMTLAIAVFTTQVLAGLIRATQTAATTVSGAFNNMSTNTRASMNTMASGFQIVIAALAKIQADSQRMATTVSGSFSNMATNTRASMNTMASGFQVILAAFVRAGQESTKMNSTVTSNFRSMTSSASSFASGMSSSMSKASSAMQTATSRANALRSAINALKSKTITITTVYVTIRRTIFAAQGGAFIQSTPGKVGPLSVSEFGQQELVTVTPIQTAGRTPVKGLSDIIKGGAEKRARRDLDEDNERREPRGKGKEVVMMRETPIIIQVDGRQLAKVVNRRLFEESDNLV